MSIDRTPDWAALRALRAIFLQEERPEGPYWTGPELLEDYDRTFAERIGWKWDALLRMLKFQGWVPPGSHVTDWGCGTGIAGRKFAQAYAGNVLSIDFRDQDPQARRFASQRFAAEVPAVRLREQRHTDVLLISHVLNELDSGGQGALLEALGACSAVVWIEPGTYADSRALIQWRERLLQADWHIVAPCTHSAPCGMLAEGNEKHWCHFFAPVPREVFHTAFWSHFRQETGVDLSTLPYAGLVAQKEPLEHPVDSYRHLGKPRVHKGGAKLLSCGHQGVENIELPRNLDKELYKQLRRDANPSLIHGTHEKQRWTTIRIPEWVDPTDGGTHA